VPVISVSRTVIPEVLPSMYRPVPYTLRTRHWLTVMFRDSRSRKPEGWLYSTSPAASKMSPVKVTHSLFSRTAVHPPPLFWSTTSAPPAALNSMGSDSVPTPDQ
jgi:hypothetical protein